jgi:hypothetical protein
MESIQDKPPLNPKPAIPKLVLGTSLRKEEVSPLTDITTTSCRSEFDDIRLPSSFRNYRRDTQEELLSDQIDKLNGVLEEIIGFRNDRTYAFAHETLDEILNSTRSKQFKRFEDPGYVNKLLMIIEDLSARERELREQLNSKMVRDFSIYGQDLEKMLNNTTIKEHQPEDIEHAGNSWKYAANMFSNLFDKENSRYSEECSLMITEDSKEIDKREISELRERLHDYIAKEQTAVTHLIRLRNDLENLTGSKFSMIGDNIEMELPAFAKHIIRIVGDVITREKEIEKQEKKSARITLDDKLQVACSPEDLYDVQGRLEEIVREIEELGCPQEYTLKVGLLSIGIHVDYSEDSEARRYYLPMNCLKSFSKAHDAKVPTYEDRMQNLAKAKPPVARALSARGNTSPRLEQDPISYIHWLEEQIADMQGALINRSEMADMESMWGGDASSANNLRIAEFELKIDELTNQLEIAYRQIRALSNNSQALDDSYYDYKDKLTQLKEREDSLKREHETLELKRQKLERQAVELKLERERLAENSSALEELNEVKDLVKKIKAKKDAKEMGVQSSIVLANREVQTDKRASSEILDKLQKGLENGSAGCSDIGMFAKILEKEMENKENYSNIEEVNILKNIVNSIQTKKITKDTASQYARDANISKEKAVQSNVDSFTRGTQSEISVFLMRENSSQVERVEMQCAGIQTCKEESGKDVMVQYQVPNLNKAMQYDVEVVKHQFKEAACQSGIETSYKSTQSGLSDSRDSANSLLFTSLISKATQSDLEIKLHSTLVRSTQTDLQDKLYYSIPKTSQTDFELKPGCKEIGTQYYLSQSLRSSCSQTPYDLRQDSREIGCQSHTSHSYKSSQTQEDFISEDCLPEFDGIEWKLNHIAKKELDIEIERERINLDNITNLADLIDLKEKMSNLSRIKEAKDASSQYKYTTYHKHSQTEDDMSLYDMNGSSFMISNQDALRARQNYDAGDKTMLSLHRADSIKKLRHISESEEFSDLLSDRRKLEKLRHISDSEEFSDLLSERKKFDKEKSEFNNKKQLLKDKIDKVNERQRKLLEREKLLTEKQTLLLLQEKKQDCHKQAMDEEWARIDVKRQDVLKCTRMIDDEWKAILEETKHFEQMKEHDRKLKEELVAERTKLLEKIENLDAKSAKVEAEYNKLEETKRKLDKEKEFISREKGKLLEERETLEQERLRLLSIRDELCEKVKQFKVEKREFNLEKLLVEKELRALRDLKDIKENKKDLSLMIPSLKK